MSHAAAHSPSMDAIRERVGPIRVPSGVQAMFYVLILIGVVSFFVGKGADPTRAYAGYLLAYWYFMSLSLAGTFFTAIHYATGATWSVVVRRVAESFTSYLLVLPVTLALLLVLWLGIPHLYVWSAAAADQAGHAIDVSKGGYLASVPFAIRSAIFLAIWCGFAWYFVRNSTRQDQSGDPKLTKASIRASSAFLLVFALTVTLASFDFLMSLEPTWYSTIFGVYCFAGLWQAGLAAMTIVVVLLRRQGALAGVVNRFHYWDLGKYMFAFSVFWMYIAFSQFMLMWYANLPEEIDYLIPRTYTGWGGVGIALGTMRFVIPFFALMHQRMKESEASLLTIAGVILIGHWLDLYWLILPAFSRQTVVLGWTEIGITLGFLGLFGTCLLRFFARYPVAPRRDPAFEASVRFHG